MPKRVSADLGTSTADARLSTVPRRGDIWIVSLGAARAGKLGKNRPAVVVSVDDLQTGSANELVVVVPVSSWAAASALRIELAEDSGLDQQSRAICRAVRSVVASRLLRVVGRVDDESMAQITAALAIVLGIQGHSPEQSLSSW